MLQTNRLSYRYPRGDRSFIFPNLNVGPAEAVLLLGPSGSGKSTWLHLLAGVLTPVSGTASLDGTEYSQLRGGALDRFRGRNIGLVFQRPYFIESLSVFGNLAIARSTAGLPADRRLVEDVLDRLAIRHFARQKPRSLSVGEQQRVTIARALVTQPRLILADEPTSALDHANAIRVSELLRERAADFGAALVVVTHDERLRPEFDRVVELSDVAYPT